MPEPALQAEREADDLRPRLLKRVPYRLFPEGSRVRPQGLRIDDGQSGEKAAHPANVLRRHAVHLGHLTHGRP